MDGCKRNDDFVKCESCLATVDDTWIFVAALLLFIDSEREFLYREDQNTLQLTSSYIFMKLKNESGLGSNTMSNDAVVYKGE